MPHLNHKLPAELSSSKGYESARRNEKKLYKNKKSMNVSQSVDNLNVMLQNDMAQ